MAIQNQLHEQYQNSHQALIEQLNEIDKNRKIYPLWTIREIVAHLSGWDDAAISFLNALLKGETPPTLAMRGIDVYNEETVSTREGLDYDHIIREYYNTRERLQELISQATDEILTTEATLPWGGKGTFEQIAGNLSNHELEHAGDLKNFIAEHNSK